MTKIEGEKKCLERICFLIFFFLIYAPKIIFELNSNRSLWKMFSMPCSIWGEKADEDSWKANCTPSLPHGETQSHRTALEVEPVSCIQGAAPCKAIRSYRWMVLGAEWAGEEHKEKATVRRNLGAWTKQPGPQCPAAPWGPQVALPWWVATGQGGAWGRCPACRGPQKCRKRLGKTRAPYSTSLRNLLEQRGEAIGVHEIPCGASQCFLPAKSIHEG